MVRSEFYNPRDSQKVGWPAGSKPVSIWIHGQCRRICTKPGSHMREIQAAMDAMVLALHLSADRWSIPVTALCVMILMLFISWILDEEPSEAPDVYPRDLLLQLRVDGGPDPVAAFLQMSERPAQRPAVLRVRGRTAQQTDPNRARFECHGKNTGAWPRQ